MLTTEATSSSMNFIRISGFRISLNERPKTQLAIRHCVSGNNPREGTELKIKGNNVREERELLLDEFLDIHEGSHLAVELYEKHLTRSDKRLATVTISFNQMRRRLEVPSQRVEVIADPKKRIWLIAELVCAPQTSSESITGQELPTRVSQVNRPNADPLEVLGAARSEVRAAKQKLERFKSLPGQSARETILKVGLVLGELHPIAKTVIACVNIIYEQRKAQEQSQELMKDLADSIARTSRHVQRVNETTSSDELNSTMDTFLILTQDTVKIIEGLVSQNTAMQIVDIFIPRNKEKIEDIQKRFITFEKEFDRSLAVDTNVSVVNLGATAEKEAELRELAELRERLFGGKEPVPSYRADKCLEDTRRDILADVTTKINDPDDKNVIWIKGSLGVGKSALAASIRLSPKLRTSFYFAFIRNDSAFTTTTALWLSIAYQLARQYPSVRDHILKNTLDINTLPTMSLFTTLVKDPLLALSESERNPPHSNSPVVIIDALDECGDSDGSWIKDRDSPSKERKDLLQTLVEWRDLPKSFKLVITSRPERDIERYLSQSISIHISIPSGSVVTDNTQAFADVRKFFEHRLEEDVVKGKLADTDAALSDNWHVEAARILTPHAAGVFQWANTIAILFREAYDPEALLEKYRSADRPRPDLSDMERLNSLYSHVLKVSFDRQKEEFLKAFRTIAGAMVLAMRPLQDKYLIVLANISPATLQSIRVGLISVIDPQKGTPLRFNHRSFDDFLLSDKCPPQFSINQDQQQLRLSKLCLATMSKELSFNMCSLETSCLKNADQPNIEAKISTGISPLLSYSCCFFADHLSCIRLDEQQPLIDNLKKVVYNQLLFWFEAMSLLKEMNRVGPILRTTLNLCDQAQDRDFVGFIQDALQFIGAFFQPIALSAPHIYLSALPFAPTHSKVAERFRIKFPHIIEVTEGRPACWPLHLYAAEHGASFISTLTLSLDTKFFAYGDDFGALYVCDTETGNLIRKLQRRDVSSFMFTRHIAFSPDGGCLVAGYMDRSDFCIWNIRSGEQHFQDAQNEPHAVTYSNDGRHIFLFLVNPPRIQSFNAISGSPEYHFVLDLTQCDTRPYHDFGPVFSPTGQYLAARVNDKSCSTITVHDVVDRTKKWMYSLPATHIYHPIFSPDGCFLVTGFHRDSDARNYFVQVHNSETGELAWGPLNVPVCPIDVAYRPNSNLLMSADRSSCATFRIQRNPSLREVEVVNLKKIPFGKGCLRVSLSEDGGRLLVGYRNGIVKMWNLNEEIVQEVNNYSPEKVLWSAVLSSSGEMVAACSNDGIHLWDVSSGKPIRTIEAGKCNRIALSLDGTRIASSIHESKSTALQKRTALQIWDTTTGRPVSERKVVDGDLRQFFFRPDDNRLVTGLVHSWDNTVFIWKEDLTLDPYLTMPCPVVRNNPGENDSSPNKSELSDSALGQSKPSKSAVDKLQVAAISPDGLTITSISLLSWIRWINYGSPFFDVLTDTSCYSWCTEEKQFLPLGNPTDAQRFPKLDPLVIFDRFFASVHRTVPNNMVAEKVQWAIQIQDIHTGEEVAGPWYGHFIQHGIGTPMSFGTVFSWYGQRLVSSSFDHSSRKDGTVRIWDASNLARESRVSARGFGDESRIEDGWAMGQGDESNDIMFWVPSDHRFRLYRPRNILILGGGIPTKLNTTKFKYGKDWCECIGETRKWW